MANQLQSTKFKIQNLFIEAILGASDVKRRELIRKLVTYLHRTRQLSKSREILAKIEQELEHRADKRVVKGEVAHEGILPHRELKTNPALLAGAKLRAGQKSVDVSIKSRLQKLFSLMS